MSQVTQRQTKMRQPVLIDEDLAVFGFEGRNQQLRLWIKLLVQQVYDRWCKVPAIRRRGFRWHAMVRSHSQEIVTTTLCFQRTEHPPQLTIHLAERDAELVRIQTVLVAYEIRAFVVQQNEIWNVVFAQRLSLNQRGHRIGFECWKQSRISHRLGRVDFVTHPLPARRPQCFRIAILQICRQPETVGVCGPVARLLIVACENDGRSIQLTRSMPCERPRRSVNAALCHYDRATSRRQLPDVSQRQYHQVLRRSSSEKVVASALLALVHADPCDSVHSSIGPSRERRVPNSCVGRKKVNPRLSEPGTPLAQCGERWHGRAEAIEVIPAHAIQDEQHDHSWSSQTRP